MQRICTLLHFIKVVITVITVKILLGWQKSNSKLSAFGNRMAVRKLRGQAHDDGRNLGLIILGAGWSRRDALVVLLLTLGKGGSGGFFWVLFGFVLRKKNECILWQKTMSYFHCKKSDWRNSFFVIALTCTLAVSVQYVYSVSHYYPESPPLSIILRSFYLSQKQEDSESSYIQYYPHPMIPQP